MPKTVWIGDAAQIILIGRIDAINALGLQFLPALFGLRAVLDLAYQMREGRSVTQGVHVMLKAVRIGRTPQVLLTDRIDTMYQIAVLDEHCQEPSCSLSDELADS